MKREQLAELKELPVAERISLMGELWDSLHERDLPRPSKELLDELERDWAAHKANPGTALSWEQTEEWLASRRR
jgi:putative addiction module component (TIGR02574 family)